MRLPESRDTGAKPAQAASWSAEPISGGITDGGQELSAESESDAGHAGDHLGERMAAKSALDVGVGGVDAFIEGDHLLRQFGDQCGGDLFAGQAHRLGLRRR